MAVIDWSSVQFDTGKLDNASEALRLSAERIASELLTFTTQHEAFLAGYKGESSLAYQSAMMTFYGKCRRTSGIQNQCSSTLQELSVHTQTINEYAQEGAEMGGAGR